MGSIKLRKGWIVAITFSDHCEDHNTPLDFTVYGRVAELKRKYVVIESWTYADDKITRDDNVKFWTIIRSAISKIVQLVPKEQ
jgi:hypothetical protein